MNKIERSSEIVAKFLGWTPEIGPCPIDINNHVWFKRLCAMGERQADLESELAAVTAESVRLTGQIAFDTDSLTEVEELLRLTKAQLAAMTAEKDALRDEALAWHKRVDDLSATGG